MTELNVTTKEFKKSWTDLELLGVKATVNNFFTDTFLGGKSTDVLATFYTSSSAHAMLNVQDNMFSVDGGESQVSYFALTENHIVVAVCYDENECEKFYRVG